MQLVEIRDLDGPNLFMLEPAIKVEFVLNAGDLSPVSIETLAARLDIRSHTIGASTLRDLLVRAIDKIHAVANLTTPTVSWNDLETSGHAALTFGWTHRRFALGVARTVADVAIGPDPLSPATIAKLTTLLDDFEPDDAPLMVRDADRNMPVVSITGTNGKTTTTRLIAHILRRSGKRIGWSSSSGVFIEGEQVMDGDYTGPSGALRVLNDPDVDIAVLETARGGILLRGIAYESNDVSVFTNISADHLDLHGVRTIEGLADAKSTVIKITKPSGFAVLNADDPVVLAQAAKTQANVFLVSQNPMSPPVSDHVARGGYGLVAESGDVHLWRHGKQERLISVEDIPIAFGGSARHMLENALCGAAACIGLGLSAEEVRRGLSTFTSSPADNLGRLNLYDVNGATIVVDFAHNEAGLRHLMDLAKGLKNEGGSITAIIGTAGDRTDENLRTIGMIAAQTSDRVVIKETTKYLRGRSGNDEMNDLYITGIKAGGKDHWTVSPSELDALRGIVLETKPGDVVAMMCVEQVQAVHDFLQEIGRPLPYGQAQAS